MSSTDASMQGRDASMVGRWRGEMFFSRTFWENEEGGRGKGLLRDMK